MPTVATTVAISAAASANAAAASARATARCVAYLDSFVPQGSSVEAKRYYAACVYRVFGDGMPMSKQDILGIKIIIVCAVIGLIAGVWWGLRQQWDRLISTLFGGFLGCVAGALIPLLLYGVWWCLRFLFS